MLIPIQEIIFYAFSTVLVFAAGMVVASRHPVRSALFLVLAFFASAGLWLLLQAEFLALILVLVYVGAVMTLFLFVLMTLNLQHEDARKHLLRYSPIAVFIVGGMVAFLAYVSHASAFAQWLPPAPHAADYSNTLILGSVLYTQYVYPFELAGVLLLVAIIAAIILSAPVYRNRKLQMPAEQMAVKRADRVRLIEMPSEKRPD